MRAIGEAVQSAEGGSDDLTLTLAEFTLGIALLSRDADADRHRGLELVVRARDFFLRERVLRHGPGHRLARRPGGGQAR